MQSFSYASANTTKTNKQLFFTIMDATKMTIKKFKITSIFYSACVS